MMLDYSPQQTNYYKQPTIFASGDQDPLHRQRDTISDNRTQREIQIKVALNQSTNYMSKFRETYHTENAETERDETEKLSTGIENQTN